MEIIPAIDIIGGKCVRLTRGDFDQQKVYSDNPVAIAKTFEKYGIKRLHLVDLDGARLGRVVNFAVLKEIASQTKLQIDFSGGIRTVAELRQALKLGAHQVSIGSLAVTHPPLVEQWLYDFGPDRILLSADVRQGFVAISGWQERTEQSIHTFIKRYRDLGVHTVICTDIGRDGLMEGPAITLYENLAANFPDINWIASGGISTTRDLEYLASLNLHGVIIGKAIYEGQIKMEDLEPYLC